MPAIASSARPLAAASSSWNAVLIFRKRRPKIAAATITAGRTASITSVRRGLITNSTTTPPTNETAWDVSCTTIVLTADWMVAMSDVSREVISPERRVSKKPTDKPSRCPNRSRRRSATTASPA